MASKLFLRYLDNTWIAIRISKIVIAPDKHGQFWVQKYGEAGQTLGGPIRLSESNPCTISVQPLEV